jgi:hypothetical protein
MVFVRVNDLRAISWPNFDLNFLKLTGNMKHKQV